MFFLRGELKPGVQKAFLGFASGVMVAASVWSLLIPAMEMSEGLGKAGLSSGSMRIHFRNGIFIVSGYGSSTSSYGHRPAGRRKK